MEKSQGNFSPIVRWGLALAGFMIGAGIVVALEVLLVAVLHQAGYRLMPRGGGWLLLPIAAGIAGAGVLRQMTPANFRRFGVDNRKLRVIGAATVSWVLAASAFFSIARPFGNYLRDDDWAAIWQWLLVPPVIGLIIYGLFHWAMSRKD